MKRLLLVLMPLLAFGTASAQIKVALIGVTPNLGESLQSILGPKYEVKVFSNERSPDPSVVVAQIPPYFYSSPSMAKVVAYRADIVIDSEIDLDTLSYGDPRLDEFEPRLRAGLTALCGTTLGTRVYFCVAPYEEAAQPGVPEGLQGYFNDAIRPLSLQAAREASATVLEHAWPRVWTPEGVRECAQFLAESIAPATLKAHWRIVRASSFQADEGPPQNSIDGDPDTFWHSEYDPKLAKPPHEIVIDLGESEWLAGFKYLPRQDGGTNGNVKDYEIYIGETPDSQTTLAAKGTFRNGRNQKIARFKTSVKGRYVRFVCLSEENGQPFASAAELDVIRDPSKG